MQKRLPYLATGIVTACATVFVVFGNSADASAIVSIACGHKLLVYAEGTIVRTEK